MIIDERYFTNPQTYIAGIETRSDGRPTPAAQALISDIRAYIDRLEPKFLRMLLGREVADNIDNYPHIRRLLAQPDKGTSVIAKYVYFHYLRDHATFNTVAGEKIKKTDDSAPASASRRLVTLWNDMVDECRVIAYDVRCEAEPCFRAEIFEPVNMYNL